MNTSNTNNHLVTFCAIAVLFLGSLYYFASVAFDTSNTFNSRQATTQTVNNYFKEL